MYIKKGRDSNLNEVLKMLTEEELQFIEKELKRNGVVFESVQSVLDNDPHTIYKLCLDIQEEEGDRCDAWERDENGNEYYIEADPLYSPNRLIMAEDIERVIYEVIHND